MANRAPGLMRESALRALSHLFASGRILPVFIAVALLMLLNWFSNATYEVLQWADTETSAVRWKPHVIFGLAAFPLLLVTMVVWAYGARQRFHARVSEEEKPNPVRGLILYLSDLRGVTAEELAAALGQGLDWAVFCQRFGRANWRMPLEAVAYHAERLSHIVVIASADEHGNGSFQQLELFNHLLKQMFPDRHFKLIPLEACFNEPHERDGFDRGVNFEKNPDRLATATNAAYEHLLGLGLPNAEILIDITGGQKVPAVVGSAVALAEGRRIQYVSTQDYHVRVYDVSYEL